MPRNPLSMHSGAPYICRKNSFCLAMRIFLPLLFLLVFLAACRDRAEEVDQYDRDTTAAPDTMPPLSFEALQNARYLVSSGTGEQTVVQLQDGAFEADAPQGEDRPVYELLEPHATGDLNGDGSQDAAVLISSNFGGSGVFVDLEAVVNNRGLPQAVARFELGDRVQVEDLKIQDDVIVVKLITHGPGDPACCPSLETERRFVLQGEKLVESGGSGSPDAGGDSSSVPV